jgi:site-specific DNA-cytosine methylase
VSPEDTHTACFTKAYSRYARGTGSVLSTADWVPSTTTDSTEKDDVVSVSVSISISESADDVPSKRPRIEDHGEATGGDEVTLGNNNDEEGGVREVKKCLSSEQINTLRLRYFSPNELLRLFGFPLRSGYSFPNHVSNKKAYELIGNSLNVEVAARLIRFLMDNTKPVI